MNKLIKLGITTTLVVFTIGLAYWYQSETTINAEKILSQSKLKERTFNGITEEIYALNGKLKAYIIEEHSIPLVAISFGFNHAGSAYAPKEGVAILAENTILDGAGPYEREQLRDIMKEKGIKLNVESSLDRFEFSLSYVKSFEKDALSILKAVLYAPHLKQESLDIVKSQLQAIKSQQQEKPQYYLNKLIQEDFYQSHPYSKEEIPDSEVLNQITTEDIRDFIKNYLTKDKLIIGITGDIDKSEAEAFITQAFNELKDESIAQPLPDFVPDYTSPDSIAEVSSSSQSFVLLKAPGIKRLDKDFYPLYIANHIFGGSGLSSRLSQAVRENEGLTYGIYSYFTNTDAIDSWQISYSSSPENIDRIKQITQHVYQQFYTQGITADELAKAKKSLMSSFNLRFASLFNIASLLEQMHEQGLGKDFLQTRQSQIEALTLEEINRAIKEKMPKELTSQGKTKLFEIKGVKK